jgi:hypothetical protein
MFEDVRFWRMLRTVPLPLEGVRGWGVSRVVGAKSDPELAVGAAKRIGVGCIGGSLADTELTPQPPPPSRRGKGRRRSPSCVQDVCVPKRAG